MDTFISAISGKEFPIREKISGQSLRQALLEFIRRTHPNFQESDVLSLGELNRFREQYIATCMIHDSGQLSELDQTVITAISDRVILTDKLDEEGDERSIGERLADAVADFGGSWRFIILFGVFLFCWILLNVLWLHNQGFDPYPFILLNLILSCIAALQAPVIMMSQNRQEAKDRQRSKKDYMINLKSELEIRLMHEKIDHLILHQHQELMEIQKIQVEMMNEMLVVMKSDKQ